MSKVSKSKTFPKGTDILIDAIESIDIDPVTKLLALSEIDGMKNGELSEANYAEFTPIDNLSPHVLLSCLFIWSGTDNGHQFWEGIEQSLCTSSL